MFSPKRTAYKLYTHNQNINVCKLFVIFSNGLGILCIFLSILILSLESSFSSSFSDSFKSAISVLIFYTCNHSVIFWISLIWFCSFIPITILLFFKTVWFVALIYSLSLPPDCTYFFSYFQHEKSFPFFFGK